MPSWSALIILFDARVHNAWSYDQLPMFQRIMNTVEKTTTDSLQQS